MWIHSLLLLSGSVHVKSTNGSRLNPFTNFRQINKSIKKYRLILSFVPIPLSIYNDAFTKYDGFFIFAIEHERITSKWLLCSLDLKGFQLGKSNKKCFKWGKNNNMHMLLLVLIYINWLVSRNKGDWLKAVVFRKQRKTV